MAAKVRFRSPKYRDFLIRALHELSVPDESKKEYEAKRCDERDEEFFPIHNLFREVLVDSRPGRKPFIAKRLGNVDLNLSFWHLSSDRLSAVVFRDSYEAVTS